MVAPDQGCKLPPEGWYCPREPGHDGPCAAGKSSLGQDWVSRMTSATAPDMTTPSSDTPEMTADKLIDALIEVARRDNPRGRMDDELTAAKQALSQYIEQRTLTRKEALFLYGLPLHPACNPACETDRDRIIERLLISSPTEEPK